MLRVDQLDINNIASIFLLKNLANLDRKQLIEKLASLTEDERKLLNIGLNSKELKIYTREHFLFNPCDDNKEYDEFGNYIFRLSGKYQPNTDSLSVYINDDFKLTAKSLTTDLVNAITEVDEKTIKINKSLSKYNLVSICIEYVDITEAYDEEKERRFWKDETILTNINNFPLDPYSKRYIHLFEHKIDKEEFDLYFNGINNKMTIDNNKVEFTNEDRDRIFLNLSHITKNKTPYIIKRYDKFYRKETFHFNGTIPTTPGNIYRSVDERLYVKIPYRSTHDKEIYNISANDIDIYINNNLLNRVNYKVIDKDYIQILYPTVNDNDDINILFRYVLIDDKTKNYDFVKRINDVSLFIKSSNDLIGKPVDNIFISKAQPSTSEFTANSIWIKTNDDDIEEKKFNGCFIQNTVELTNTEDKLFIKAETY